MLLITGTFAALLTLLYVWLAFDVIRLRRLHRVSLGTGEQSELTVAIRTHGNFAEYTPLMLLLMACLELNGWSGYWLWPLGGLFLVGRWLHVRGIRAKAGDFQLRVRGMQATFGCLVSLALLNLLSLVLQSPLAQP
jgi:uncharacterized membrane protein YecN with MAPEG domain